MPFDSYIKAQLLTKTTKERMGCISFDSYIKPQRARTPIFLNVCCISFDSYIKPQLTQEKVLAAVSCISFDSYIKPRRMSTLLPFVCVVYLLIPTSNHDVRRIQEKVG